MFPFARNTQKGERRRAYGSVLKQEAKGYLDILINGTAGIDKRNIQRTKPVEDISYPYPTKSRRKPRRSKR